jgi:outer membrane immunogenic protein
MKKQLIGVFVVLFCYCAKSQAPVPVGGKQLNAGVGFSSSGIPIYVGMDFGVHKDITVGGELSYRHYNEDYEGKSYGHSGFGIVANGNYHFNTLLKMPEKWNLYAGANIGFTIWTSPDDYNGDNVSGIGFGGQIGGRYFFNEKFGLNLEFGGGSSLVGGKFGITMKM